MLIDVSCWRSRHLDLDFLSVIVFGSKVRGGHRRMRKLVLLLELCTEVTKMNFMIHWQL